MCIFHVTGAQCSIVNVVKVATVEGLVVLTFHLYCHIFPFPGLAVQQVYVPRHYRQTTPAKALLKCVCLNFALLLSNTPQVLYCEQGTAKPTC